MNKEDLFNELGNISPEYIEEAEVSAESVRKSLRAARKRWIAAVAAFVVMVGAAASQSEAVQAAIKKMFTFIPGVGIEETTEENVVKPTILYSMDGDPVTKSNDLMSVTLENAYMSSYGVDIVYRIKLNFIPDALLSRDEMQKLLDEKGVSSYIELRDTIKGFGQYTFVDVKPTVTVNGVTYSDLQNYGGGSVDDMTYTISVISDEIKEYGCDTPVTFSIGDLSFDLAFKPIETYDTIEEIGPTAIHNGISVTAVPRWDGDTLYIKFYSLNYSEFDQVYGYTAYNGEERILPYIVIDGQSIPAEYEGGDGTEYYFDLSSFSLTEEQKASIELHAPVINVRNDENTVIEFTVNSDGTVDHPDKLSLSHSELEITGMSPVSDASWKSGIEMSFISHVDEDNIYLSAISLTDINGRSAGGSGSWTSNENNIWSAGFTTDSLKTSQDYKSVKISSAEYILTDEYVFILE